MSRVVIAAVIGSALALGACSGGGASAIKPFGPAPACPLLAQLAQTGEAVAHSNVGDPAAFQTTLKSAVASYVHTAKGLRAAVPKSLRSDVEQMIDAAQQRRFADAQSARTAIDDYAQSACKTT